MADYTVVTREAMTSEYDGTKRKSAKFYAGANNTVPTQIENGMVVKIDGIITGKRELFKVIAPASNTPVSDLWIVTTPEVVADERKKNLCDFINPADKEITIDKLTANDIFSVTAEGLSGTAAGGYFVGLQSAGGVKLGVASTSAGLGTVVGKVLDVANAKVGVMVQ